MWEKIKNICTIIVSFLAVILLSVFTFLFCKRSSNRTGSTDNTVRDRRITEGIGESQERTESVQGNIKRAEESIRRSEQGLQRAKTILRDAIRRSKEGKSNVENGNNN